MVLQVEAQNDIAVTVTANQDELPVGGAASYTVVVTNNGPQVAPAVELRNELPAELVGHTVLGGGGSGRRLPVQVPAGCLPSGRTATCALGDLAVGATRTFTFGGTVANGTPVGTRLVDTATVSTAGVDTVAANNTDDDVILVIAAVRLRCADLTFAEAQRQLAAGATYLDGDNDGTACDADSGGGGSLPATGAAVAGLLAVGMVLVASGGGLRATGRRVRRRR